MSIEKTLEGLTDDQQEASTNYKGACFILAGPGAGKTKVIVSRTAYMIEKGVKPETMIVFTFTNKAAGEIKERIRKQIGEDADKIMMGTYHSVCNKFLRKYATKLGFTKRFSIYDTEDTMDVIKELTKGTNLDKYVVSAYISDQKNKMILPSTAMSSGVDSTLASIYEQYQTRLLSENAMDFDDLIYNTILLFRNHPDVIEAINKQYKYITADEGHDSSIRDMEFIKLLAGEEENVCVISDDDQSIYGFRGSDIDSFLKFDKQFNNTKKFVLRQNFRSTEYIVEASRSLIAHNKNQNKKDLYTKNEKGTPVISYEDINQKDESLRVVKTILFLVRKYGLQYKDIAILYRMSYLSRNIEEGLLTAGIPYNIIGGCPFYSRKEIKDILSYMRLMVNPYDYEAFKRCINTPKRALGDVAVEAIVAEARTNNVNLIDACRSIQLKGKAKTGLASFNTVMENLMDQFEQMEPSQFVKQVIVQTGYEEMLRNDSKKAEATERLENLNELVEMASKFYSVDDFLQNITLNTSDEEDDNDDKVQLMTMHASKGLEFKAVIIIGANEGISPHWKSVGNPKQLEEERRLFYVAMTRAQKYLFITRPKMVMMQGALVPQKASRFINEIHKDYIVKYK